MPRQILITVRKDSSTNWTSVNPTLDAGEFGYETNSGKVKVGNGLLAWNALPYLPDTLHDNVVSDRFLRDSTALSVLGRSANTLGDPGDINATTDEHVLRRDGSSLGFGILGTESFADGAVITGKILDGTIDDDQISNNAEINPSKFGPGPIPEYTTVTTVNYPERSITVDKLSDEVSNNGVGVWRDYPLKMYVIHPRYYYGYVLGGLPWWAPYIGVYRLRRPRRYFIAPLPDLDDARQHEQIEIKHAKYCVINDTCFVSALVQLTNRRQFQSLLFFNLPHDPVVPDNTCIGEGYHLNSDTPRNMPALRAIKLENEAVGFMGHRYQRDRWWWWEEANKSYYYGVFEAPDRVSFNLRYEISETPLLEGNTPTFGNYQGNRLGYTVNITDYDPEFSYSIFLAPTWLRPWRNYTIPVNASAVFGKPNGNILPITVTGIRRRRYAVIGIRTERPGYETKTTYFYARAGYWYFVSPF